ncbi:TPA: hypothetical protein ACH3X3_002316 [Trebouxia sp. C0006]
MTILVTCAQQHSKAQRSDWQQQQQQQQTAKELWVIKLQLYNITESVMTWNATGCTSAASDITRAACLGWLRPLQNSLAQIVQNLMRATLYQVLNQGKAVLCKLNAISASS